MPNNNIAVLVLTAHPSEDARIIKHWEHTCRNYNESGIIQILFAPESNGRCCENWHVIKDCLYIEKLRRRIYLGVRNRRYIEKALTIIACWKSQRVIVHVHDAVLLPIAVGIKKASNKCVKIIYDKHENGSMFTTHLSVFEILLNEWSMKKYIDGIVFVSKSMNDEITHIWGAKLSRTMIPNYPKGSWRIPDKINQKIFNNNDQLNVVYFGSLGQDRDLELVHAVSIQMLITFPQLTIVIGGRGATPSATHLLNEMHHIYGERFQFLGEVPYSDVIQKTQEAQFGFIPIRPGKGLKGKTIASNKLSEYLLLGVVPLISWGDSQPVISEDYYISLSGNPENYLVRIKQELNDHKIAQRILENFYSQTWENFVGRYDDIYRKTDYIKSSP